MENTIITKLAEIQRTLKAPKGQLNKFGGYNYRSCEDILEAVKPLLGDCVLTVSDIVVEVGGRIYVKATAVLRGSNPDHSIEVDGWARESETRKGMDDSQITGSASSYARKYALNGLFCIDDSKDADATNDHGKAVPEQPKPKPVTQSTPITAEQDANIRKLFEQAKYTPEIAVEAIKWASDKEATKLAALTSEQATKLAKALAAKIKKGESK